MIRELLNIRSFADLQQFALSFPDPRGLWDTFVDTLRNPGADPLQTTVSLSTAVILLLIFAVLIAYFVLVIVERRAANKEIKEFEESFVEKYPEQKKVLRSARFHAKVYVIAGTLVSLFVLLLAANGVTSSSWLCKTCHSNNVHFTLEKEYAHADTSCVSCHEGGNFVTRSFTSFVPRMGHIITEFNAAQSVLGSGEVLGSLESTTTVVSTDITDKWNYLTAEATDKGYGSPSTGACFKCHKDITEGVVKNDATGIKVRHSDFLETGERCASCHGIDENSGTVNMHSGMNVCITCHDGKKASADCTACHTKDIGAAAASRSMKGGKKQLVAEYDCYSCHNPVSCDNCHGTRLPHSEEFMTTGLHAYEGAKSLWSGKSGKCVQCHNEDRNSCNGKCHSELPYHFSKVPSFKANHGDGMWGTQSGSAMSCSDCHSGLVKTKNDDVCSACHKHKGAQ